MKFLVHAFVALVGQRHAASIAGRLMAELALASRASGDSHEVRHMYMALTVGDSSDCEPGSCRVDGEAFEKWRTWKHGIIADALGLPR